MPIRITGLNSGLDTESIISALVSSYSYKTSKYKKAQTKLSWKQEAWSTLNSKVYSFYNNVGKLKLSSAYNMRTASVSDSTKAKVSAASGATNGVQSLEVLEVAKSDYLTGGKISIKDASGAEDKTKTVSSASTLSELGYTGTGTIEVTNKETGKTTSISVTGDTKISDFVKSLSDAGVKASFDEKNGRLFVSSAKTGTENGFELKSKNADGDKALLALGLAMTSTVSDTGAKVNDDNNWSAASDAKIKLNGAEYTSSTNEFAVNGLSVTALAKTSGEISVTVATDSEGIYEQVKDLLSQYNSLINEMNKLYNADSAKGYEPLTDDEKDSMSDTEVEKWEAKVKDSLLRRDDSLESLISSMTTAMSKGYEVNGKTYYLTSFGISTLGYMNSAKNEQYAYHINGDEDDSATSGKEDKLLAAIKEDPDSVAGFMQQLATGLYDSIDKKMKTSTLSSIFKVYNDRWLRNTAIIQPRSKSGRISCLNRRITTTRSSRRWKQRWQNSIHRHLLYPVCLDHDNRTINLRHCRRLNLHKEKKKTHGGIFTCLIIMAMLRMRIAKL